MGDRVPTAVGVTVLSASGLPVGDVYSSDPYCVCEIVGKPETQCTTGFVTNTLNPYWNEAFVLNNYEVGDYITFTVFDVDHGATLSRSEQLCKKMVHSRQ